VGSFESFRCGVESFDARPFYDQLQMGRRMVTVASTVLQYALAYAVALPMYVLYRVSRRLLKGSSVPPADAP
jgi:hypothetical protein